MIAKVDDQYLINLVESIMEYQLEKTLFFL